MLSRSRLRKLCPGLCPDLPKNRPPRGIFPCWRTIRCCGKIERNSLRRRPLRCVFLGPATSSHFSVLCPVTAEVAGSSPVVPAIHWKIRLIPATRAAPQRCASVRYFPSRLLSIHRGLCVSVADPEPSRGVADLEPSRGVPIRCGLRSRASKARRGVADPEPSRGVPIR